jgi:tRNA A-37 threonylcarbamoyl transferase component Bud32
MSSTFIFPLLAILCGLFVFIIVIVGMIRSIAARPARLTPPADPKSVPLPAQPAAGPARVPRVVAGCGLVAMIPLALMVVYFALPEWQRLAAAGNIGMAQYLSVGFTVALFAGLCAWLVRVIRGPKPVDATANPVPPGNWLIGLILVGTLVGLLVFGFALPAWLKEHPNAPAWATEYIAPAGGFALWVVLLVAMIGLLGALRRSKSPPPDPKPEPQPSVTNSCLLPQNCPKCGQPIPAGSPQGLCPRCLLQGVILPPDRPSPTLAFVEAYVAPPVEEVAKLFPHLEVKELIGQGGMGAVYLARQTALDRLVALKLVRPRETDPTFAERFVREAKAMARLNHPHVVAVYESGAAGGLPYLVMEYVDGVTLRDAMRERKLSPAEALAIVPQICDALEYAHGQGVVHRDVKPENILLGRDGRVKIADFGLAKVTDPAGVSLTGTRQAMGTPHYMAPEQWEKPGEVDHRADIYALGVVLYELLTGELPLGRFDPPSQKIQLDIRLDEVVLRALAKEPDRRYQHASDVKTALDAIRSGAGGWVKTPTFREYRSKQAFLGLPLVHVVGGLDPLTGRPKTAKGWLAIGDARAIGGIARVGGRRGGGLGRGVVRRTVGGRRVRVRGVCPGRRHGHRGGRGGGRRHGDRHSAGSGRRVCRRNIRDRLIGGRRAHPVGNPARRRLPRQAGELGGRAMAVLSPLRIGEGTRTTQPALVGREVQPGTNPFRCRTWASILTE